MNLYTQQRTENPFIDATASSSSKVRLTVSDANIQKALSSNGVHFFAKDMLRKGITLDCVDAYHDALLVTTLLKERMDAIFNEDDIDAWKNSTEGWAV